MRLSYDPKCDIGYLRFHEKSGPVTTLKITISGKLKPPPLWFWNPVAKLLGRVNPEANGLLSARQCCLISVTVGHTPRKLRNLSDKGVVLRAPIDDHFVPIHR
jgi:hypothetical protein